MPETTSGVFRPSENIHSINEFKANFLISFKVCLILVPQEKMGTLVPKVQVHTSLYCFTLSPEPQTCIEPAAQYLHQFPQLPDFNSAPPQLPPCKLLDPHTPQPVLSTIFPSSVDVSFMLLVVPAKELLSVLPLKYTQTLTSSCHLHCTQHGLSSWYFLWIIARACKAFLRHGTADILGQIILCCEARPLHLG